MTSSRGQLSEIRVKSRRSQIMMAARTVVPLPHLSTRGKRFGFLARNDSWRSALYNRVGPLSAHMTGHITRRPQLVPELRPFLWAQVVTKPPALPRWFTEKRGGMTWRIGENHIHQRLNSIPSQAG